VRGKKLRFTAILCTAVLLAAAILLNTIPASLLLPTLRTPESVTEIHVEIDRGTHGETDRFTLTDPTAIAVIVAAAEEMRLGWRGTSRSIPYGTDAEDFIVILHFGNRENTIRLTRDGTVYTDRFRFTDFGGGAEALFALAQEFAPH